MSDFGMPFLLELNDIEACAALCRELGLSFVELNACFPGCLKGMDAQTLRVLSERYGIYFTLHAEEDFDPFHFTGRVRRAWMDTLLAHIDLAKEAGIPLINMHLPAGVKVSLPSGKVYLYAEYRDEYRAAVTEFRDSVTRAVGDSGIRMAVENTNGFAPHEREAIECLLASPVFGLTLDIGHSHGVGDVDIPFYATHRDRLIHMHGHDGLGRKNHLALGDGEIDLKERFGWAFRQDARIVLETKTVDALRTSVQRLPRYLPENCSIHP